MEDQIGGCGVRCLYRPCWREGALVVSIGDQAIIVEFLTKFLKAGGCK